jgi:hypothetical protein
MGDYNSELNSWFSDFPLEVRSSEHKGRYVVASRDIKQEELVLYAWPYVSVVHHDQCTTICAYCFADILVFVRPKATESNSTDNGHEVIDTARAIDSNDDTATLKPKFRCHSCQKIAYCSRACREKDAKVHLADECRILQTWQLNSDSYSSGCITEMKLLVRVLARRVAELADQRRLQDKRRRITEFVERRKRKELQRIVRRQQREEAKKAARASKAARTKSTNTNNDNDNNDDDDGDGKHGNKHDNDEGPAGALDDEIEEISSDDENHYTSTSDDDDDELDDLLAQDKHGNWLGVWDNAHRYEHYCKLIAQASDYPKDELESIHYWQAAYVLQLRHWLGRSSETLDELTDIICRNRRNGFGFGNGKHCQSQGTYVLVCSHHSCAAIDLQIDRLIGWCGALADWFALAC